MLIGIIIIELAVLIISLAMLIRPQVLNCLKRRVACALRLRKHEMRDKPIPRWQNISTAIIGFLIAAFIVTDLSNVCIGTMGEQVPVRTSGSMHDSSVSKIDALVMPEITSGRHIGIVVGVIHNGEEWTRGYGRKSIRSSEPPNENSIFEIGSITKTFTCTMLAAMCLEGSVQLNDPVSIFLPETVNVPEYSGRQITLEDLATHTSGLPRIADNMSQFAIFNPYADYGTDRLYQFLNEYSLQKSPGSEFEYSNLGMGLLGLALSRKAGTSYEQAVDSFICEPLGLHDTTITLSASQKARLVPGNEMHQLYRKLLLSVPSENWTFQDSTAGTGALRYTALDMLKFLQANIDGSGTVVESAMEMTHKPRHNAVDDFDIGLSWLIADLPWVNEPVIWHNGGTGGYRSIVCFCKKRKLGVVVLSNSVNDVDILGLRILKTLAAQPNSQ